jgi:polysaccharide export outer membrane protein
LAFGALGILGGVQAQGGAGGQIPFDAWRVSLAEAVAKSGGLNDGSADPAAIFLYRGETREVAERLGIDCSPFAGPVIPVIYNINFRDPAGYFLATKFEMRNKDVIYVSNATSVEATKFLNYLRTIVGTINDPMQAVITGLTIKQLTSGAGANVIIGTPIVGPTTPVR